MTRQMGFLFVGRVVAFAFTFAIPLVLVRVFSQEDFGLYKQLFLLHGTLLMLLNFGLPSSLYYFLPRDVDRRRVYVSQALILLTTVGTVGIVGLLLLKGSLAVWLNNPKLEALIPYMGIVTGLLLVSRLLEIVMITGSQAKLASVTIVVSEFMKAVLIIGATLVTGNMLAVVVAVMALGFLRTGALIFYLKRESFFYPAVFQSRHLHAQLAYALPFWIATLLEMSASVAPQFYVASLYDPAMFAVFAVGCFSLPIVPLLFESVSDVTLVKITEHEHVGAIDKLISALSNSVRTLCLVFFPLFLFLLTVAGEFIVALYTTKFEESIPVFVIFIFALPLQALSMDYVPQAFADTRFLLKMYGLRAILTIVLLFLLTKRLGLTGAALALIVSLAISRAYALCRVAQLTKVGLRKILPWAVLAKILVFSMIPAVFILSMKRFVDLPALLVLFGSLFVFSITYGILIWNSRLITSEEKGAVSQYIQVARELAIGLLAWERRKISGRQ